MESDRIIVSKILNGEGQAFEIILKRYQERILSFIYRLGIGKEEAQDIAQEVFIKVYNNLYSYQDKWEFSTWIFTIAANKVKDSKKVRKFSTYSMEDISLPTKEYIPEEHMDKVFRREFILEMFKTLDDNTKTMLILFYYADLPIKEIAKVCNAKPDVIKMKIHRARQKLCDQFEKRWGGERYAL